MSNRYNIHFLNGDCRRNSLIAKQLNITTKSLYDAIYQISKAVINNCNITIA
jgi:hypothetical protein